MSTTISATNPIVYSDLNYNYGFNGLQSNPLVYNIQAIIVKIINTIFTPLGSRHFEPLFGSEFPDLLFSNIDPVSAYTYMNEILIALSIWVPMVTLDRSNSFISGSNEDTSLYVNLTYYIDGIQSPQTLKLRY
jgi:phage baseplate assembly protein W